MRHPDDSTEAPAAAEIAALGTLTIGCFGLTAPFFGFHSAVTGGAGAAPAADDDTTGLIGALAALIGVRA